MNKLNLLTKRAKLLCLAPTSAAMDAVDMAMFFWPLGFVAFPAYLAVRTAEIIFASDSDIERM